MPGPIYVMADDGMLYKNPLIAGVVDDGLVEFFVCISDQLSPEVVVEVIKNYRPHRGYTSQQLWGWYERAAKAVLTQMQMPFAALRRALVCDRMFLGENLQSMRASRAFSFFFDLVEPIPRARIGQHEGVIPHTEDMQRPEGAYAWVVEDADEREQEVKARVEELRASGAIPDHHTQEQVALRLLRNPEEPPEHPQTTPQEFTARHDEIAGPDNHKGTDDPHTDRDS